MPGVLPTKRASGCLGLSHGEQPEISLGVGEPARAQRRVQDSIEYNFFDRMQHNQLLGIGISV